MGSYKDIVFVTPSYEPNLRQESIGTLILAKKAMMSNYSVGIVRFWEAEMNSYIGFRNSLCDIILKHKPKVVSFYCRGAEYHILIDISNALKKREQGITIVFGGPQSELVSKETLKLFKSIDYICCGEGENTIVPLLDMIIQNNLTANTIPGLVYRDDKGQILSNMLPELLPDKYVRSYYYYDIIPDVVISNSNTVSIDVGRGCPFSCTFCSTKSFWKQKYRLRDTNDTINEINYVVCNYGDKIFEFSHDLFTTNKKRIIDFCDKLLNLDFKIKWSCSSRIDSIDYEMIDKMTNAGLISIYFGIETGSPRMQGLINKNLDIQRCIDIVKYATKKNVNVTTSFIYGFPQETFDDLESTLSLINTIQSFGVDVQLHTLTLERGSALYNEYHNSLFYPKIRHYYPLGYNELSRLIEKYPEVFSTYWDFHTTLRDKMKYLHVIFQVGKQAPLFFNQTIDWLHSKGISFVDSYCIMIETIKDSLDRFEKEQIQLSKSICIFLLEKMRHKLPARIASLGISICEEEIQLLLNIKL